MTTSEAIATYRTEKAKAAERHAPDLARRAAELKASWDREMALQLAAQKGGRPRSIRAKNGGFA